EVRSVSPRWTLPDGGTQVTVTGYGVGAATQVLFGSTPATSFSVLGPGELRAVAPPHAVGALDITVVTPSGTTAARDASHFYYQATSCGTVITRSTTLTSDIGPCYTSGLSITADRVTLDLNGHGVIGFPGPSDGNSAGLTLVGRSKVTVEN